MSEARFVIRGLPPVHQSNKPESEEKKRFAAHCLEPNGFRLAWVDGWLMAELAGKRFMVSEKAKAWVLYPILTGYKPTRIDTNKSLPILK